MTARDLTTPTPLNASSDCWSRWTYMVNTGEGEFTLDEWHELAAMAAKLAPADVPFILDAMALDYPPGSTGVYDDEPWGAVEGPYDDIYAEEMLVRVGLA